MNKLCYITLLRINKKNKTKQSYGLSSLLDSTKYAMFNTASAAVYLYKSFCINGDIIPSFKCKRDIIKLD